MLADLILHHLPKDKCEKLLMILSMREVFAESLRQYAVRLLNNQDQKTRTRSKDLRTLSFCALKKLPTATEMAKSTSSARTYSRRCILALASAILKAVYISIVFESEYV
jgi:hypothetical protein